MICLKNSMPDILQICLRGSFQEITPVRHNLFDVLFRYLPGVLEKHVIKNNVFLIAKKIKDPDLCPGQGKSELMDTVIEDICIRSWQDGPLGFEQGQKPQHLYLVPGGTLVEKLRHRACLFHLVAKEDMPFLAHAVLPFLRLTLYHQENGIPEFRLAWKIILPLPRA